MSLQMMLPIIHKSTGLPESAAGATPCDLQDGLMIDQSGQEARHANLSPRQAKEAGLLTSGTYGHRFFGTSGSVNLTQSLANKLAQKLDLHGSMLWHLTWKHRATASGRLIYALRGRGRSTSGKGSTSWPTPAAYADTSGGGQEKEALMSEARIPRKSGAHRGKKLRDYALLAAWTTPSATDGERGGGNGITENMTGSSLTQKAAMVSPRATPKTSDYKGTGPGGSKPHIHDMQKKNLKGQVVGTSGQMSNGSNAPMESKGQLNPEFSLWLMGFPTEWASCGARVTR